MEKVEESYIKIIIELGETAGPNDLSRMAQELLTLRKENERLEKVRDAASDYYADSTLWGRTSSTGNALRLALKEVSDEG